MKPKELKFKKINLEVWKETMAQDKKWGPQTHPFVDATLAQRGAQRLCEEYEIPTELRAKFMCDNAEKNNNLTWAHIMVEEMVEAITAETWEARRKELIQLMAVIQQSIVDQDVVNDYDPTKS